MLRDIGRGHDPTRPVGRGVGGEGFGELVGRIDGETSAEEGCRPVAAVHVVHVEQVVDELRFLALQGLDDGHASSRDEVLSLDGGGAVGEFDLEGGAVRMDRHDGSPRAGRHGLARLGVP